MRSPSFSYMAESSAWAGVKLNLFVHGSNYSSAGLSFSLCLHEVLFPWCALPSNSQWVRRSNLLTTYIMLHRGEWDCIGKRNQGFRIRCKDLRVFYLGWWKQLWNQSQVLYCRRQVSRSVHSTLYKTRVQGIQREVGERGWIRDM